MLSVLASGVMHSDSKQRTDASGEPFVTALSRVPSKDDSILVNLIACILEVNRGCRVILRSPTAFPFPQNRQPSRARRDHTKARSCGLPLAIPCAGTHVRVDLQVPVEGRSLQPRTVACSPALT